MKSITSLSLIISFLLIAILGLAVLDHGMDHQRSDCAVSVMSSAPCPTSIRNITEHHISAIRSLLSVPLSTSVFLVIILFVTSLISLIFSAKFLLLHDVFFIRKFQKYQLVFNLVKLRLLSWLALYELSPSVGY